MTSLKDRYQARFGIKQPLRGYQLKAARVGLENPSYALLMAPRLGKTRIDISVTGYRHLQGEVKRWVIICPSIAKEVWATEIADTLDLPHELSVIEGKADERKLLMKGWGDGPGLSILIINPEATWRLKKLLYKTNPDKVTLDESHRIKNHAAKQSKTIHILGKRARYRTILTGTFLSTPTDAFSQFKFLSPSVFGERWKAGRYGGPDGFLERYVETYGFGGHKPKTFKNLDELQEKVSAIAYQLTREQAGGFPHEQYQTITFELTAPAKKHYADMENRLKTIVNGSQPREVIAEIILTQVLRLQQITGGFLPVVDPDDDTVENIPLGTDRIKAMRELVSEYPLSEPLVVFYKFRYELTALLGLMERMGRSVGYIAGGMPPGARDKSKRDFQGGLIDTMLIQIRAGIAIDLSRANTGIFYSSTPSLIDYDQAKARIIARTGGKVSILHLAAKGTVDEDILVSLKSKGDLARSVLNRLMEVK